jgi:hypothetical protein
MRESKEEERKKPNGRGRKNGADAEEVCEDAHLRSVNGSSHPSPRKKKTKSKSSRPLPKKENEKETW